MADFNSLIETAGSWLGNNTLWVSPEDFPDISDSTLSVIPFLKKKFVRLDYTWKLEGELHEGNFIIGFQSKRKLYSAVWLDTWHMGDKYMTCQGLVDENGSFVLMGYYEVTEGPDYGWKTVIEIGKHESLRITMFNVTPEGKEQLAVKSVYKKKADSQ
jgi:hypothetical protein